MVQKVIVEGGIRTYVIWIPMLDRDEGSEVPSASTNVRLTPQYFDGTKLVGNGLAHALGIEQTVWDAFLFYPPGATWTDTGLPAPELALVQDNGVVLGLGATLPGVPDQSKLPAAMTGKAVVVGAQSNLEALLRRVTDAFVARHRTPR